MSQLNVIWNRDTWVAGVLRLAAKEHVTKVSSRIEQIDILLILDQHRAMKAVGVPFVEVRCQSVLTLSLEHYKGDGTAKDSEGAFSKRHKYSERQNHKFE